MFAQGDGGKFLANKNSLVCLLFRRRERWDSRLDVPGGTRCLAKAFEGWLVSSGGCRWGDRATPLLIKRVPVIAILYAPDKHYCWSFFDIRNGKYALDRGLVRH